MQKSRAWNPGLSGSGTVVGTRDILLAWVQCHGHCLAPDALLYFLCTGPLAHTQSTPRALSSPGTASPVQAHPSACSDLGPGAPSPVLAVVTFSWGALERPRPCPMSLLTLDQPVGTPSLHSHSDQKPPHRLTRPPWLLGVSFLEGLFPFWKRRPAKAIGAVQGRPAG